MIKIKNYGPVLEWRYATDNHILNALSKPFWTSCFLIDGLLIDTGAPSSVSELRSFLRSSGPVDRCVITHWHEDHAGGGQMLLDEFKVPVYADPTTIGKIAAGYSYPFYRRWAWGKALPPVRGVMPLAEKTLTTGSGACTFDVLILPGHADGLVALAEMSRGWIFAAEAVMPRYRMLFGGNSDIREDIDAIYESIRRLREIAGRIKGEVTVFIAGHGGITRGREFLAERIKELEDMRAKAHDLQSRGLTDKRILREMFGGESVVGLITGGALSRMNLVRSLLKWRP
jgi:glyoxylase-like metal-dependent hydrolase (beta-lactamase superfamily II)